MEIALHSGERAHDALLRIQFLGVLQLVDHELLCVFQRYVEQLALVAALRNGESDVVEVGVGHHGHYHLLDSPVKLPVYLGNGEREHLIFRFIEFFAVFERQALHYCAFVEVQVVHIVAVVVVRHRINVEIVDLRTHDYRFSLIFLHKQVFLLHGLSFLKPQLRGKLCHLLLKVVAQLLCVAA